MLKGQLSVGFILRMAVGMIILVALTYTVIGIGDSAKRESQKQSLISISEKVGVQVMGTLGDLESGQNASVNITLPISQDTFSGQYGITIEDKGGGVYVKVHSQKWPDTLARQPLYLDSSRVVHNDRISYPKLMCLLLARNDTHYTINITC